jgi:endonuclease-3
MVLHMAASSKAQYLTDIQNALAKRYSLGPRGGRMSVLEAVIYGICHEGTTREQANQALGRFKDQFFDWNEIRVSTVPEIEAALAGLPAPAEKAQKLRRFLRQLFSKTYKFDLDHLLKKPLKESIKALQEFEAPATDYVLGTVVQQALGGHAIPVDGPIRRCLTRLEAIDAGADNATVRSALERAVPKTRGVEFADLLEELAHDTCVDGEPDCPRCVLVKLCPTGKERLATAKAAESAKAKALKGKVPAPEPAPAKQEAAPKGKVAGKTPRPK